MLSYKYYDTPDGEDCFKKLWFSTRYATMIGLSVSTADVLLHSHPKGYFQTAARYAYITGPLIGMAAAFTVTTCLATNIRKRDDHLNYVLGGCAVGSVYGAWKKSGVAGFVSCVVFAGAAIVLKSFVVNKWPVFPQNYYKAYGTVDHYMNDWTLVKERPRGWKKSEDE